MIRKILAGFMAVIILCLPLCSCQNASEVPANDKSLDTNTGTSPQSKSEWVNTPIFKDFILFDADGDGVDDHVVEHNMVAMSGGHGGYELYIYAKNDVWGYDKIFDSNDFLETYSDMGIRISEMNDGKIKFQHKKTGYEAEYVVDDEDYPYLFNEDGKSLGNPNFLVDTFKTVEVVDVDGDGAEELVMKQYCSIGWHANYIGDFESIWQVLNENMILIDSRFIFNNN